MTPDQAKRLSEALDGSLVGPNMQSASAAPEDNEILDPNDVEGLDLDQEIEDLDAENDQEATLKTDLEAQKEAEQAAQKQNEKVLRPQVDDLTKQVTNINQDMLRGMGQLQGGTEAVGQLDQQMAGIRNLLQTLRSSLS